jgi:hypothetical protein
MVRQIAPVFFTVDIPAALAYYTAKLGFECLGTGLETQSRRIEFPVQVFSELSLVIHSLAYNRY